MELLVIDWMSAFYVIGFTFLMVFVLLISIILILSIFGKIFASINENPKDQEDNIANSSINSGTENPDGKLSSSDIAAIGMALLLYHEDIHDEESNILTIKRVNRRYSPWSSKIFGLDSFAK